MLTFQELIARGEAVLREAKANGAQESLTLDFKSQSSERGEGKLFAEGKLTTTGKSSLAKALSAFSNSAGGLIIFGINCRSIDGVDCIQELEPIANWSRAQSEVSAAVGDLLQPKNDLVEVHGFATDQDGSLGYIVVNVPRSERRPHRSEAKGCKQYFKRSGSGSYAMEHYDIEDAFMRTGSPNLSVRHELLLQGRSGGPEGVRSKLVLRIVIVNTGVASAKHVTMVIYDDPLSGTLKIKTLSKSDNNLSIAEHVITLSGPSDFVVHPGQARLFQEFEFEVWRNNANEITIEGCSIEKAHFSDRFDLFAENTRPLRGVLEVTPVEMNAAVSDL